MPRSTNPESEGRLLAKASEHLMGLPLDGAPRDQFSYGSYEVEPPHHDDLAAWGSKLRVRYHEGRPMVPELWNSWLNMRFLNSSGKHWRNYFIYLVSGIEESSL